MHLLRILFYHKIYKMSRKKCFLTDRNIVYSYLFAKNRVFGLCERSSTQTTSHGRDLIFAARVIIQNFIAYCCIHMLFLYTKQYKIRRFVFTKTPLFFGIFTSKNRLKNTERLTDSVLVVIIGKIPYF